MLVTPKSLIHNRAIAKCFSFYEKCNFDFTNMFCGTTYCGAICSVVLLFNKLILNVWSIIWTEGRNLYFHLFLLFYQSSSRKEVLVEQSQTFQFVILFPRKLISVNSFQNLLVFAGNMDNRIIILGKKIKYNVKHLQKSALYFKITAWKINFRRKAPHT